MKPQEHKTREAWMVAAMWQFIDQHFTAAGYDIPSNIRVTCGWPSKNALARKVMRVAECWDAEASGDNTFELSVSPAIDDAGRVIDLLIHEAIHATVGVSLGHRKEFSQCAKKVGLLKPWVATTASDSLKMDMAPWLKALGTYPHAALGVKYGVTPDGKEDRSIILVPLTTNPPQKTRMIRLQCESCNCIVRTTRKWLDKYNDFSLWLCPCGSYFQGVE